MSEAFTTFAARRRRIERVQKMMANRGRSFEITRDGLIVVKPKKIKPYIPARGLAMLIGALILFKAFLLLHLGPVTYLERIELLRSGSVIERGGAFVMQPDAVSTWVAAQIQGLL